MKKQFMLACSILALLTLLISCSKSDSELGDGNNSLESYWPLQKDNYWDFYDDSNDESMTYEIFHTINFEGINYHSFIDQSNSYSYPLAIREDKGLFKMYYGAHLQQGVQIGAGSISYLNTNLAVNETWTDQMALTFTSTEGSGIMNFSHSGRILEKTSSETVNGISYQNIIKAELVQKVNNTLTGQITNVKTIVWLSKGVGPIREIIEINGSINDYLLTDYKIDK